MNTDLIPRRTTLDEALEETESQVIAAALTYGAAPVITSRGELGVLPPDEWGWQR